MREFSRYDEAVVKSERKTPVESIGKIPQHVLRGLRRDPPTGVWVRPDPPAWWSFLKIALTTFVVLMALGMIEIWVVGPAGR